MTIIPPDAPIRHSDTYRIRTWDIDARGALTGVSYARMLFDVAGQHARMLGLGIHDMFPRGYTWVLSRFRARLDRVPRLREEITVETFPAGLERLYALREFRVSSADGASLGSGSSAWLILRLDKRRPSRPGPFFEGFDMTRIPERGTLPDCIPSPAGTAEPLETVSFLVRNGDIDGNGHVTSASYCDWAAESVPRRVHEQAVMTGIGVDYLAETFFGEEVTAACFPATPGVDGVFLHELSAGDGRVIARVRTEWDFSVTGDDLRNI